MADTLIEMLRNNKVTGAFLVLNTENLEELSEKGVYKNKPGIYVRDYDPKSSYSDRNTDLLLEFAPTDIVKNMNIRLTIFFYGYQEREEIRACIRKLQNGIRKVSIELPDHTELPIRMSAGIAWYPDDTAIYQKLKTYADFAMYQIKYTSKNQFGEFDKEGYMRENYN